MTDLITNESITTTESITTGSTSLGTAAGTDVVPVASVLAQAFFDDPVFRWCLPEPRRRGEVLLAFFELIASAVIPYREVHVAGATSGVALWVPPGLPIVSEEDGPAFEVHLAELFGEDGERAFDIMALLDEHHPTDPHRFLWFLGVRPEAQRQGIGSMLIRSALARCDREGVPAYLDATSEDNRRLYQRHGFEVMAERSTCGSPPLWAMWREPQADQRTGATGR